MNRPEVHFPAGGRLVWLALVIVLVLAGAVAGAVGLPHFAAGLGIAAAAAVIAVPASAPFRRLQVVEMEATAGGVGEPATALPTPIRHRGAARPTTGSAVTRSTTGNTAPRPAPARRRIRSLHVPDPTRIYPSTRQDATNLIFVKNVITSPLIEVGDYTYYDNEGRRPPFETGNVVGLRAPHRLVIGRFTTLGPGVTFLMSGGHTLDGPAAYPFDLFGGAWAKTDDEIAPAPVARRDVHVGNDVWIGRESTILSGVTIGDGAVVLAGSIVTEDVEPYQVVGGNPARHVRWRYEQADIDRLLRVRWWDWPMEQIVEHAAALRSQTPAQLELLSVSGAEIAS